MDDKHVLIFPAIRLERIELKEIKRTESQEWKKRIYNILTRIVFARWMGKIWKSYGALYWTGWIFADTNRKEEADRIDGYTRHSYQLVLLHELFSKRKRKGIVPKRSSPSDFRIKTQLCSFLEAFIFCLYMLHMHQDRNDNWQKMRKRRSSNFLEKSITWPYFYVYGIIIYHFLEIVFFLNFLGDQLFYAFMAAGRHNSSF